jgi:hypothetical protein
MRFQNQNGSVACCGITIITGAISGQDVFTEVVISRDCKNYGLDKNQKYWLAVKPTNWKDKQMAA